MSRNNIQAYLLGPPVTRNGQYCQSDCILQDNSYFWCWTKLGLEKGFCIPNESKHNFLKKCPYLRKKDYEN